MLVLSREQNEKIIIGEDVWVIFLGMNGNKAKIGFIAPRNLSIHREEIYHRIKAEKLQQTIRNPSSMRITVEDSHADKCDIDLYTHERRMSQIGQ